MTIFVVGTKINVRGRWYCIVKKEQPEVYNYDNFSFFNIFKFNLMFIVIKLIVIRMLFIERQGYSEK